MDERHDLDRMDSEGGHLSHAARVAVLRRRFHRAAKRLAEACVREQRAPLSGDLVGAHLGFMDAWNAWQAEI